YSLEKLAVLVRTRQISSEELTRFFMKRLRSVDSSLHCVITMTEERALEKARMADREIAQGWYRGPLHGIPYGAKDLLAVRGYPTTWGQSRSKTSSSTWMPLSSNSSTLPAPYSSPNYHSVPSPGATCGTVA